MTSGTMTGGKPGGFATAAWQGFVSFARLVKIEHSVFALPFAYCGMVMAAGGWPGWRVFILVTVAMVAMRSFAMIVNRLADLPFDRRNPRTQERPLVTGAVSVRSARRMALATALVFVLAAAGLNTLVLSLTPVALILAGGYSYAKRFTFLCHYWLGAVLGLAPVAGWLAVVPAFHMAPVLLGLGVTFWVAGFDILYATQDVDFDRQAGLRAIPARFGIPTALAIAAFSHANTAVFFLLAGWAGNAGWPYYLVAGIIGAVLAYEHTLVRPDDLRRVNTAFFTVNGVVAIMIFAGVLLDLWLA